MATLGKITVTYASSPTVTTEVTRDSNMVIDGVRVGSGGDRPLYQFGPNSFAGPNAGFLVGGSGITSMTLVGSTLTIVESYGGATTTTAITVDSSSAITVDHVPNRNSASYSILNTGTVRLLLAGASTVSYAVGG
jgi:hypothetical protein